jgi:curved DNA-binding protein CbpA
MMSVKDYYHVLNIPAGSSTAEIKKAFRRLVMTYHPDKQSDSAQYNTYFSEIQEAYAVLSDPEKREQYHYQRWLEKSMGYALDESLGAEQILKLFIKVEKYIAQSDKFRLNKQLLLQQLQELYSHSRLNTILREENLTMIKEAIKTAIRTSENLDSVGASMMMKHFEPLLQKKPEQRSEWESIILKLKREEKLSGLTVPVAIIITIILCLIVFFGSRR